MNEWNAEAFSPPRPSPGGIPHAPAYRVTPPARFEPAATLAFILALLSFVVWFIPALVALLLAPAAKRNIAELDLRGRKLASAAQIIALVGLVFAIVGLALIALT